MGKRGPFPAELRRRAIDLYTEHGAADAERILTEAGTPVDKGTIRVWASRAGVSLHRSETVAAALKGHTVTMAQRRARLADRLLELAEIALEREFVLVGKADVRDVVGVRTRAIHDHQLLAGEATARTETTTVEQVHGLIDELRERKARKAREVA